MSAERAAAAAADSSLCARAKTWEDAIVNFLKPLVVSPTLCWAQTSRMALRRQSTGVHPCGQERHTQ